MKALIRFWRTKLRQDRRLMSQETRVMLEETIRCLRELGKSCHLTRVQREADIVRTVTELSMAKREVSDVRARSHTGSDVISYYEHIGGHGNPQLVARCTDPVKCEGRQALKIIKGKDAFGKLKRRQSNGKDRGN